MLGFHVSVYRQQDGGAAPAAFGAERGPRLAVWQTGVGGLDWIDDLVKEKKAVELSGNGYPTSYTARAEYVIPHLAGEIPEARAVWGYDPGDILMPGWEGKTTKDSAVLTACRPDEWLLIVAWDES